MDVDAGACAFGIFALEQMGDSPGELDHLEIDLRLDRAVRGVEHVAEAGAGERAPIGRG
jgi:hypothetical protein